MVNSKGRNFTEKKISEDEEKIRKVITVINENSNPFTINHCTKATFATGHLAKREYIEHIFIAKSIGQLVVVHSS